MCGIVGYVGWRPAEDILLSGLQRLEYRGYDSAGIALIGDGDAEVVRAVGNIAALRAALQSAERRVAVPAAAGPEPERTMGIGHTRWATHGRVSESNAHPHADETGVVQIVLNGIVENHAALRDALESDGVTFTSQTDAEVVAHLVARAYEGDLADAVRAAYVQLEGHYAIVVACADEPDMLVAIRKECPLVIGRGDGEQYVASAIPGFLAETAQVQHLEDGELAVIRSDGVTIHDAFGTTLDREVLSVDWCDDLADKDGSETFMLKEIHEQSGALSATFAERLLPTGISLGSDMAAIDDAFLRGMRRIVIVACGTSYHAGLIGRYAIEEWARLPVDVDIASEFRYRNPLLGPDDLVIGISQSGETADTLAAMRLARRAGARVLALVNVVGSQATREADGVLYTRAGTEVGVAATKTFLAQVAAIYLVGLRVAQVRGTLSPERLARLRTELASIPRLVDQTLAEVADAVEELAQRHAEAGFFLYLGRHIGLPVALEGALKLKEIAYVPTDAYAAGEMKHGPIALLSGDVPVLCIATDSPVLEKLASNMQEVRARGARAIAIATAGNLEISGQADAAIEVPATDWLLQPLLSVLPLQLLAYHVARLRGLDVDQPRNLAKTVTVE